MKNIVKLACYEFEICRNRSVEFRACVNIKFYEKL